MQICRLLDDLWFFYEQLKSVRAWSKIVNSAVVELTCKNKGSLNLRESKVPHEVISSITVYRRQKREDREEFMFIRNTCVDLEGSIGGGNR